MKEKLTFEEFKIKYNFQPASPQVVEDLKNFHNVDISEVFGDLVKKSYEEYLTLP